MSAGEPHARPGGEPTGEPGASAKDPGLPAEERAGTRAEEEPSAEEDPDARAKARAGPLVEEELGPYKVPSRRVRGVPARTRRRRERRGLLPRALDVLLRLIASCAVIGIGIGIAVLMRSQHAQGWLVGLVVAAVSVVLSGVLWSRRL